MTYGAGAVMEYRPARFFAPCGSALPNDAGARGGGELAAPRAINLAPWILVGTTTLHQTGQRRALLPRCPPWRCHRSPWHRLCLMSTAQTQCTNMGLKSPFL
ncbi:hypothetical protein DI396_00555 [Litorivita pollutaquae]|uniref:Uncharacterized protein n=1 Tax=Litorivita pollutaquae TaxID=2200892 RepID=A0A2V4N613_9RHOB|nr:hypothetical protein DI396_00555 [Litorivita pollutaquae]